MNASVDSIMGERGIKIKEKPGGASQQIFLSFARAYIKIV